MNPKPFVPDVWGEDWETTADKQASSAELQQQSQPPSDQKLTGRAAKAQRRAAQAEFNRQLWAEAEAEKDAYQPFLETRNAGVPLKSEFKPQLKLLSRKPVSTPPRSSSASSNARQTATNGVAGLVSGIQRVTLATPDDLGFPVGDDGDDDDEEDERNKEPELTPEERMRKAQAERAEKQRKYEELREQLFGSASDSAPNHSNNHNNHHTNQRENSSGRSGNTTPGSANGYTSGGGGGGYGNPSGQRNRNNRRGGGGGGGGGSGSGGGHRAGSSSSNKERKQLYDPNYSSRPSSNGFGGRGRGGRQQNQSRDRDRGTLSRPSPATEYIMPIRAPKGPDGSGRGGFGFAPRGGRTST